MSSNFILNVIAGNEQPRKDDKRLERPRRLDPSCRNRLMDIDIIIFGGRGGIPRRPRGVELMKLYGYITCTSC